ncbi:MAG: OmpA family protein [Thiohalomonadales bacterium]
MFKNTSTLGLLIASLIFTACAGNDIKQEEMKIEKNKSASNLEVTKDSNVALSDFSDELSINESDIKSNLTKELNDTQNKDTLISKQPTIKVVNFNFDKFKISDKNQTIIKQHAEFLVANPTYVLSINGHSDYRGPQIYNEKLSLRRANSVATLLMSYGAPESQLIINSYGSSKPVENYDNWYQNRRVEFEYSELYMVSKQ